MENKWFTTYTESQCEERKKEADQHRIEEDKKTDDRMAAGSVEPRARKEAKNSKTSDLGNYF